MAETSIPQLGWTKQHKLTVNGERVQAVTWYEGFVALSTSRETYNVDSAVFERFVSEYWDPSKTWAYL